MYVKLTPRIKRELFVSASGLVTLDHTVQGLSVGGILAPRGRWRCLENLLAIRSGDMVLASSG